MSSPTSVLKVDDNNFNDDTKPTTSTTSHGNGDMVELYLDTTYDDLIQNANPNNTTGVSKDLFFLKIRNSKDDVVDGDINNDVNVFDETLKVTNSARLQKEKQKKKDLNDGGDNDDAEVGSCHTSDTQKSSSMSDDDDDDDNDDGESVGSNSTSSSASSVDVVAAPFRGKIVDIDIVKKDGDKSSNNKLETKKATGKKQQGQNVLSINIDTYPLNLTQEMIKANVSSTKNENQQQQQQCRVILNRESEESFLAFLAASEGEAIESCRKKSAKTQQERRRGDDLDDDIDDSDFFDYADMYLFGGNNNSDDGSECDDDTLLSSASSVSTYESLTKDPSQELVRYVPKQRKTIDEIHNLFVAIKESNVQDLELRNFGTSSAVISIVNNNTNTSEVVSGDKKKDDNGTVEAPKEKEKEQEDGEDTTEEGKKKKFSFKDLLIKSLNRSKEIEKASKDNVNSNVNDNKCESDDDDALGKKKNRETVEDEVQLVSSLIENLPSLKRLSFIPGDGIDGCTPEPIVQAVTTNPTLRVLQLGLRESESLSKYLSVCKNLHELRIVRGDDIDGGNDEDKNPGGNTKEEKTLNKQLSVKNNADMMQVRESMLFKYTTVHAMSTIRSLPMATNLRVLDLGKGIGLSGFTVQLLTNGLSDKKTMKGMNLEELYFTYDPNKEIDNDDKQASSNNSAGTKIIDNTTYDEKNYQHRILLELNNKVVLGFCNVIQTNKSLRVIKNHAYNNMLLVGRASKDEMQVRLTGILLERKLKQEEKKAHKPKNNNVDDGDKVVLDASEELKAVGPKGETDSGAIGLPKELKLFPGSQDVLDDVLIEISKPPTVTTASAVSSLMCAVTECFMIHK